MKPNREDLPKGYMGTILTVDLSNKAVEPRPLERSLTDLFFGGRGLGCALLFDHFIQLEKLGKYANAFKEVDPFSPDNALVFSTAPTTATDMVTSGRFHVNFKSPLTGGIGSTNSGGKWAIAFKKSGYDALTITGKSPTPIFLHITPQQVDFLDADALLDLNIEQITDHLTRTFPKGSRVMAIGAAGRNQSRIAAIMNDRGRAMGRGGGGGVFGAKNLMAIVVTPDPPRKVAVADRDGLRPSNESGAGFKSRMKLDLGKLTRKEQAFGILPAMGTLGILGMVNAFHELTHNNMHDTRHRIEDVERISGEALRNHKKRHQSGKKRIDSQKGACHNCPIACTRMTKIIDEQGQIVDHGEGPEFETVALLGANLSIYDLVTITEANYWANRYGLDTISLGGTIAALFDLNQTIKKKEAPLSPQEEAYLQDIKEFSETYGEPGFGRKEVLLPLIHTIAGAEGIGRLLAQGSYRFCAHYGHPELSMSVKKMELPAYDPRAAFLQGLCYEMNNRGGCHLENGYTAIRGYCAGYAEWPGDRIEGTAIIAKNAALGGTAIDIIGACAFASLSLSLDEFAALVNAVTGAHHNAGSLEQIAWRTLTLERSFNLLAGFSRDDDRLPERFFTESIDVEGKGTVCRQTDFDRMHREYHDAMGWDKNGVPTAKTIEKLGLGQRLATRLSTLVQH